MTHKMVRSNTVALKQVKDEVMGSLEKAEQKKEASYPDAIHILFEAVELLPRLTVEDSGQRSVRNSTQNKDTQEILYMSKRGNILYELKEFEEAKKCHEFISQRLPNNVEVHKSLGDCLRKLNKFKDASEMYDRGLVIYEKDDFITPDIKAALLNSRGLNYMEQEKYSEARNDFETAVKMTTKNPNPLYLCNKGYALYALKEKDEALKSFKEASELVMHKRLEGLTRQNVEFIRKTLEKFVEGIQDLKNVILKKQDSFIEVRELGYIKTHLDAFTLDDQEDEEHGKVAAKRINDTKLTIQKIQNDTKLFEYYDGFLFALSKSYNTAVIINSGQELFHTSREMDTLASAIQLMPLVGPQLCDNLGNLATYMKGPEVMKAAGNICKFATSQSMFLEIVQDALVEAIDNKQNKIRAQEDNNIDESILPKLASKYRKIVEKINKLNGNGSEMLYGERNETPLQKLGCMTANTLMSEHVASGNIYNGELAIKISKDEKKKRFVKIVKDLFEQSLDKTQQPQQTELVAISESRGSCANCRMF